MWMRNLFRTLAITSVCIVFCAAPSTSDASTGLRSAYLGPSAWEENLDAKQINTQLREHFVEVLGQLESKNASSLLTALSRAEATSPNRWTKSERRAALVYLAHNRQTQIARLRSYADRGLFPINEGQATDAAPIFVDRRETHCAVGYLMHVDGRDAEVASVVSSNNLIKVMDAKLAGLSNWIRTSGLTREEAAMIQPAYPVSLDATFEDLATTTPTITGNGLTLSSATIRGSRFTATLPTSFQTDPGAIDDILEQGKAALDNNNVVGPDFRSTSGVLFGEGPPQFFEGYIEAPTAPGIPSSPDNLDDWLYIGSDDILFGGLVGGANASGNVGIIEIEYELTSNRGDFSQIALTANEGQPGRIFGDENALLVLSEILDGDTGNMLGEASLFFTGPIPNTGDSSSAATLTGSDTISLATESVRIRTYGLVAGARENAIPLHSFFHQFETTSMMALKGDVDLDGDVDFADIPAFITVLLSGAIQAEADCDCDGDIDFDDIPAFIAILLMQ